MSATLFDGRLCKLGEGPLWHPERKQLFWFDILGKRLLSRDGDTPFEWQFDECVSAAGWIDRDTLLIASETALFRFDLILGVRTDVTPLEADNPATRSNDGRADPWGGFWIGTMGKHAEAGAGAIYRFFQGELRTIAEQITVSNAICFAPGRPHAYYTDTVTGRVLSVALDPGTGWPNAAPRTALDLKPEGLNPDGAVTDAAGNLWIAEWGAARVSCYAPDGTRLHSIAAPALQTSCPVFAGPSLRDLYITSASVGLSAEEKSHRPLNGATFIARDAGQGVPEPQVML